MKTRKWPLLLMAILTVLSMSSCQDWGEADPPAGNQKLPAKPDTSAKLIAEFTFDEDFNSTATEGETPVSGEGFAYSADQEIVFGEYWKITTVTYGSAPIMDSPVIIRQRIASLTIPYRMV